jgi:hypothetical protein
VNVSVPLNDVWRISRAWARAGHAAAANHKRPSEKYAFGLPHDPSTWTDEDHECFLAALLDMEREEREQAGLLGRWPIWEIRRWAILHPDAATQLAGAGILVAGIMLGLLGPVLIPWIAWALGAIWQACGFLAAVVTAFLGASYEAI